MSSVRFWIAVILVSGVLILVSQNVVAAALIPVLSALRSPWRAANWIRKCDPVRKRAQACSRYLVAVGCWSALVKGIVATVVLAVSSTVMGYTPSDTQVAATILAVAGSAVATSLIGLLAFWTAWRNRVRVWAHPRLLRMADYEFSNLSQLEIRPATCNHAVYVTALSVAFPVLALATAWMILTVTGGPPNEVNTTAMVIGFVLFLAGPIGSFGVLFGVSSRIFAASPMDCWSADATSTDC